MKTYKKTYYFDCGNRIEIVIRDKNYEEIEKDIEKSINGEYIKEIFKDRYVCINMNNVNYITVEEEEQ